MSFRSPFPDVEIPNESVYDFLFGGITPDDLERIALIDSRTGDTYSYRRLIERIAGVAADLLDAGIGRGEVVALYAPNGPEFAAAFHGILRAGAVATTVNTLYTADDIAAQLADSGARLILTVSDLVARATEAGERVGLPRGSVIALDSGSAGSPRTLVFAPEPFDPATQLAVIPYSSGTTGRPKGVMLTHRNLVANVCQVGSTMSVDRNDWLLAVLPFFHIYGMTVLLNAALYRRACLVTMPRFELQSFLRTISDYECTCLFIAPPIAVALAKHPLVDQYDLSAIHTVYSGAAALDSALAATVAERLDCAVRQGYGMSEMSPVSHAIPWKRDDISLDTVGVTIPNMECKLVDVASGREIDPPAEGVSEPGELWCKGPNVMRGYLGNEDATSETIDADGFLHTGDIATVDSQGVVRIVDRLKELIKYKGYQVPPAELEAVLLTHPDIADAAVVGAADDDGQEIPKAFVVRQPGASIGQSDVIAFVAESVAPHKRVRAVEFIDSVPRSSTGKILRRELRR